MFNKLTNLFSKSFTGSIASFGGVASVYTGNPGRVSNVGKFDILEHNNKKFDLQFSNHHFDQSENRYIAENRNERAHNEDAGDGKTWSVSSWVVAVVALIAFLLVNGEAKAEEEVEEKASEGVEKEQARSVTKENFHEIIIQLKRDDLTVRSLEIGYRLTKEELKEILESIKNNTELGYITWHKDQVRYQGVLDIENRLVENNRNYRYYPNDYTHALLSKHAYVTSKKGSTVSLDATTDKYLKDWKVFEVCDDTQNSGYYGVIYKNDKTHQVVLANRGTEEVIGGLFNRNGDWKTNLEEILGGNIIVGQQAKNLRATAMAIELAKESGYRLSFAGHSLGAWLAELSAYYSYVYFDFKNVKAVTFDSPGTVPMMEKLQSNILGKDAVKFKNIDIVTYLANPNPVNSCNGHVGRVYKVEPKMNWTEKVESKLPNIVKNALGDKIKGVFSVEGHLMAGILATFDPETGKPRECKKMLDWPRVEYLGDKSFSSEGKQFVKEGIESTKIVEKVVGSSSMSVATEMALNMALDHLIGDRTIMTIIGFLKTYVEGGIDPEQYWSYFRHIGLENKSKDNGEERTELSFDNRFALYTLGKYREGKNTHLMKLSTGSVDKYLYKLDGFREKLKANEELPSIVKRQLNELLESFKIGRNGEDYVLIPNQGQDIDEIRARTQRLLDVIPRDIRKVWQNVVVNKTKIYLTGEIEESGREKTKKLPDNLTALTAHYIGIRDKEKALAEKLGKEHVVVISGIGGMGKSTLATKYGKDCKQEGWQVRWLQGMQIDEEFLQLARELKIKTNNLSPREIRDLVYKEFEKIGKEKPVLLIFDNVEDGQKMREYLVNRSARTKVIITSRDGSLLKEMKPIQMEGFDREQAIEYLKEALGKSKSDSEKLVEKVGLSPFRLSRVVAYLWSNDLMSINEYIKYYDAILKGNKQNADIYPEVEMLFGDLKQNAPVSWQLLQYMAYLDAEGVPLDFITQVMGLPKEDLQRHVNELKRLSLMSVVTEGEEIILKVSHRIVQEETKKALIEEDASKIKSVVEKLVKELNNVLEDVFKKHDRNETPKEITQLIKHVKMLISEAKTTDLFTKEHPLLILTLGVYYNEVIMDYREALQYWEEYLKLEELWISKKLISVDPGGQFKGELFYDMGQAYCKLGGEANIRKSTQLNLDSLKIYQNQGSKNHEAIGLSLFQIGINYFNLNENQTSLNYCKDALKAFRMDASVNRKHIEETLFRLGIITFLQKEEKEVHKLDEIEKRGGIKYFEEALNAHYKYDSGNNVRTAELLGFTGWAYLILGDNNKYLEYGKQAYSLSLAELGSEHGQTKVQESGIKEQQPYFFSRKGSLQEQTCLGGNKVGNECRNIITTRGETDENLIKVKQKIQGSVLHFLGIFVDDEAWVIKHGWTNYMPLLGDMGVKGHLEKDYLKGKLEELGNNDKNIELAQMLCFETTNLAIMKSEKKAYEVVQSFTKENPELVKKIALEHPEFFVDGSIVEACIKAMPGDRGFERHILKHVKYMGMEERKKAGNF